jgi:chaperonin GroES
LKTERTFILAKKPIPWLIENINKVNLAENLKEDELNKIASKVHVGYKIDLGSRSEWEEKAEEGLKIARQITEKKNYPFENAANIKYPLIAISAINFAARVYPQIIQGSDIVKAQVIGKTTIEKEQRAKRVGQHMSYQLLEQMTEWEEDTDQLLTSLPVLGMYFRKTYYDSLYKRNRSIGISPLDLVVNNKIKSLDTSRRITEKIYLYKNDVLERERTGQFIDTISSVMEDQDEDKAELFLEQHTWLDLDDDGYDEPYIVTIHEQTQKLCRITARYDVEGIIESKLKKGQVSRINPIMYYTDYGFLPDPKGGYYKIGFSHLLSPINESISTVINQLLDAGHWANTHNGFIAQGIRIKGGKMTFEPNEWKMVDTPGSILKDGIVPLPTKEPSAVLFQLLGLLIETGKSLSSVTETMTGEMPGQNTPATTVLAMIEQGLKVFSSIYKRVFKSLKSEYKKLYRLNRLYMDEEEYIRILDDPMAVFQSDYNMTDLDIVPIADPTISSEAQRIARARAIMDTMAINPCPSGKMESLKYYYEAIGVPDLEKFMPQKEVQDALNAPPPPDPKLIETQAKVIQMQEQSEHAHNQDIREQVEMEARVELIMAQVKETNCRAIKNIAEAEAKEAGYNIESYKIMADREASVKEMEIRMKEMGMKGAEDGQGEGNIGGDDTGRVSNVESPPDNSQGVPISEGNQGMAQGGVNESLESQLGGANSVNDLEGIGQNLRNQFNAGNEGGIEGRATGGKVNAGQPYKVGEEGEELFVPIQDGVIIPINKITLPEQLQKDLKKHKKESIILAESEKDMKK